MEPTTNLPVNSNPEPKYISVTVTETPGGYNTAVITDPNATVRDRFRMAVHITAQLARMVAEDGRTNAWGAAADLMGRGRELNRATVREDELFTPPTEWNADEDA